MTTTSQADKINALIEELGTGDFSDRVHRTRAILGESTTQFGVRLRASHSYIVMLEQGRRSNLSEAKAILLVAAEREAKRRLQRMLIDT